MVEANICHDNDTISTVVASKRDLHSNNFNDINPLVANKHVDERASKCIYPLVAIEHNTFINFNIENFSYMVAHNSKASSYNYTHYSEALVAGHYNWKTAYIRNLVGADKWKAKFIVGSSAINLYEATVVNIVVANFLQTQFH